MYYLAGVIVVIGLAAAVLAAVRKSLRGGPDQNRAGGLTLTEARELRARGVMTQEEFDQVRQVLIGAVAEDGGGGKPRSAL